MVSCLVEWNGILVIGGFSGSVRLVKGKEPEILGSHSLEITCMAAHKLLLTGSSDTVIKVWDQTGLVT